MQRLRLVALTMAAASAGCTLIPNVGPSANKIEESAGQPGPDAAVIQVVTVDDAVARRLLAQRKQRLFSEALGGVRPPTGMTIGPGDAIEVNIWEAPPATLFSSGVSADLRGGTSGSRVVTLPEQVIDRDGFVNVPFAGKIAAAGRSLPEIEQEVARRLKGKANQPEILVRRVRNASSTVTVVGEVGNSVKVPLTPSGERLLDALAAAGGVRQPVNKMTVQITRGSDFYSMPLQTVIRDPRQNVSLQAGDVVTAIAQSLSFTALGSTIKQRRDQLRGPGHHPGAGAGPGGRPQRQPLRRARRLHLPLRADGRARLAAPARGRHARGHGAGDLQRRPAQPEQLLRDAELRHQRQGRAVRVERGGAGAAEVPQSDPVGGLSGVDGYSGDPLDRNLALPNACPVLRLSGPYVPDAAVHPGRAAIDYEAVARAIDVASFFPAVAPSEQLAIHWSRNLLAPAAPWTRAA